MNPLDFNDPLTWPPTLPAGQQSCGSPQHLVAIDIHGSEMMHIFYFGHRKHFHPSLVLNFNNDVLSVSNIDIPNSLSFTLSLVQIST